MKPGDLVAIEMSPLAGDRKAGIILKKIGGTMLRDNPYGLYMVMTDNGKMMWLQKNRLRVISESR